jgi:hypothetical protein
MTTNTELQKGDTGSTASGARTEAFKSQVSDLKIKDSNSSKDPMLMGLGLLVMVAGVVVAVVSYFMSHGTSNSLSQNDALTIGMIGIALSVLGAALFLRYSFSNFLRFWLARVIFEQQKRD